MGEGEGGGGVRLFSPKLGSFRLSHDIHAWVCEGGQRAILPVLRVFVQNVVFAFQNGDLSVMFVVICATATKAKHRKIIKDER